MTLKDTLYNYLKEHGVLTYGKLCEICAEEGYKVDTGRRRLDEMSDVKGVDCLSKRGTHYIGKWILESTENAPTGQIEPKNGQLGLKVVYQIPNNQKVWKL